MLRKVWFYLAYNLKSVWDTGVSPPELLSLISTHTPGRALDLGCGTGTNVITLARAGWKVTGIDYIPRALRIAKKKAQQNKVMVDLLLRDITHLGTLPGPYDLVLDMGCFHSLSPIDRANYIATIHRLLAPRGKFLLYVFFKTPGTDRKPGVEETDILHISDVMNLVNRVDGTERSIRPSAWLHFQKPE